MPRDGGRCEPACCQPRMPAAKRFALAGFGDQSLLRQKTAEVIEIAAQRAHRVR